MEEIERMEIMILLKTIAGMMLRIVIKVATSMPMIGSRGRNWRSRLSGCLFGDDCFMMKIIMTMIVITKTTTMVVAVAAVWATKRRRVFCPLQRR